MCLRWKLRLYCLVLTILIPILWALQAGERLSVCLIMFDYIHVWFDFLIPAALRFTDSTNQMHLREGFMSVESLALRLTPMRFSTCTMRLRT